MESNDELKIVTNQGMSLSPCDVILEWMLSQIVDFLFHTNKYHFEMKK